MCASARGARAHVCVCARAGECVCVLARVYMMARARTPAHACPHLSDSEPLVKSDCYPTGLWLLEGIFGSWGLGHCRLPVYLATSYGEANQADSHTLAHFSGVH